MSPSSAAVFGTFNTFSEQYMGVLGQNKQLKEKKSTCSLIHSSLHEE